MLLRRKETPEIVEKINLTGAQLEFASEVYMYINSTYANTEGLSNEYLVKNMGLLLWREEDYPGDQYSNYENCDLIMNDVVISGNKITTKSHGIPAKEYGDEYKMRVFLRMPDGSYVYSRPTNPYSPQKYAEDRLRNSSDVKLKKALVAMLDYGTAAQYYFKNYRIDDLANDITVKDKSGNVIDLNTYRTAYTADMIISTVAADKNVLGSWARNKTDCPTISPQLEMAGRVNYMFTFKFTSAIREKAVSGTAMFWDKATYEQIKANGGQFSEDNATLVVSMPKNSNGYYYAVYDRANIADLGDSLYVCGVVTDASGNTYTSGVVPYNAHAYASDRIKNGSGNIIELSKTLVVYSNMAKAYFDK